MIYMDNAATTRVLPEVLDAMLPYFTENFGNPSAFYAAGRKCRSAISAARASAARLIGAKENEIFFTSGGTESDNWAVSIALAAAGGRKNHIITTKIEHPAVLRTLEHLEKTGQARVTYLNVDSLGFVRPEEVRAAISDDTCLISVMAANNEIGTIEPIREIGEIAKEHGILFHTDAVQAFGQIPIDVNALEIDLLSASAHKLHGPKGTGCLYIREGTPVSSFIRGGSQERNRRAGTENVPGIVGFGKACAIAEATLKEKIKCETDLRDHMIGRLTAEIPGVSLNGPVGEYRLPGNINVRIDGIEAEALLIVLDFRGIAASAGSACSTGSLTPSHVLRAIGLSDTEAKSSIRLTLSEETTKEETDQVCGILREEIGKMRERKGNL